MEMTRNDVSAIANVAHPVKFLGSPPCDLAIRPVPAVPVIFSLIDYLVRAKAAQTLPPQCASAKPCVAGARHEHQLPDRKRQFQYVILTREIYDGLFRAQSRKIVGLSWKQKVLWNGSSHKHEELKSDQFSRYEISKMRDKFEAYAASQGMRENAQAHRGLAGPQAPKRSRADMTREHPARFIGAIGLKGIAGSGFGFRY